MNVNRFEPLLEVVLADPLYRATALIGVGLVWLTIAWLSVMPLLLLAVLVAGVYHYRRRNPAETFTDEDLDTL